MNRIILNETSYFGAGCRSVIAVEAARRGFKKAFFVTDKDLIKFGVAAEIIKVFDDNHIPYELYSDVKANPTIANVQNGVAAYKASGADFIVALGGGSSIDTAKGIGMCRPERYPCCSYCRSGTDVFHAERTDCRYRYGRADSRHRKLYNSGCMGYE